MTLTKICTKCGIEKPLDEFGNAKNGKYGKRGECKKCNKIHYTQSDEQKNARRLAGQKFDNSEYGKTCRNKYIHSDKGKENARDRMKKFSKTDKFKIVHKRYEQSEKGKENRQRYSQSDKGKQHERISRAKYLKSDKGKESDRKKRHNRQRGLNFIPLNNILPGHDGHHIDHNYIIYIPEELHRSCPHALKRPESMREINEKAWKYLNNDKKGINYKNLAQYNAEKDPQ